MKISRFATFNESHTQDEETFKYVFIDLIDEGFEMELEKGFFADLISGYSENADQERRKAGYVIKLHKSITSSVNGSVDFESAKTTMSLLEECNSKLGGYGEFSLKDIEFDNTHFRIEYRLIDNESKEAEVNTSEGFDDFVSAINSKWREAHNKLTRSFDLKVTKEGITLSPKAEVITRTLLSTAKTFIHKCVDRRYWRGGGPNWLYKYDVKMEGDKIHITFKERIDETIYRNRQNEED